jgi:hypothetical protein
MMEGGRWLGVRSSGAGREREGELSHQRGLLSGSAKLSI